MHFQNHTGTEIGWNHFLKFNSLGHRTNQGIRSVHMDLVADGGACFPKTDSSIQSPGICMRKDLPGSWILRDTDVSKTKQNTEQNHRASPGSLQPCSIGF